MRSFYGQNGSHHRHYVIAGDNPFAFLEIANHFWVYGCIRWFGVKLKIELSQNTEENEDLTWLNNIHRLNTTNYLISPDNLLLYFLCTSSSSLVGFGCTIRALRRGNINTTSNKETLTTNVCIWLFFIQNRVCRLFMIQIRYSKSISYWHLTC